VRRNTHRKRAIGKQLGKKRVCTGFSLSSSTLNKKGVEGLANIGLGKSRGALALALLGGAHSLIVLEPQLVDEMAREIAKIGLPADLWQVITTPDHCRDLRRINIISYNRLRRPIAELRTAIDAAQADDSEESPRYAAFRPRRTYAHLLRRRIGTLVADEADVLTNPHSQQSQAIAMISPKRRYLMTGTPVRNMPRDLLGVTTYAGGDGTVVQPFGRHRPYMEPYLLRGMDHAATGTATFIERHSVLEWVTHEFVHSGMRTGAKREVPKVRNLEKLRTFAAPLLKRRVQDEPDVAKYIRIPKARAQVTTLEWDTRHLSHYLTIADDFAEAYKRARKEAEGRGTGLNCV